MWPTKSLPWLLMLLAVAGSLLLARPGFCWEPMQKDILSPDGPPLPDNHRPQICTQQYVPVCGRIGSILKTYSNECFARVENAIIITVGPCGKN
jgi:hypothetical protein